MSTVGTKDYPYWRNEFDSEFKGFIVCYRDDEWKNKNLVDYADSYRVFMILCNNNSDKSRPEVLQMLKDATQDKPIRIQNEVFWTEKD